MSSTTPSPPPPPEEESVTTSTTSSRSSAVAHEDFKTEADLCEIAISKEEEEEENNNDEQTPRAEEGGGGEETEEDIYGQIHIHETPLLISEKLREFDTTIKNYISSTGKEKTTKDALQQAQEKCPELLDDDFKLMFLRCGDFNIQKATERYISYWNKRLEIFGPEKAFLPLTLDGALKGDEVALSIGVAMLPGTQGLGGRSIVFADPSKQDRTKYERKSLVRAFWYVFHAALQQNVETQQKGVVFVIFPQNVHIKQVDRALMKLVAGSIKSCLPLRVSGFHIVHPPVIISIVLPILKLLLGAKIRKRIRIHSGSTEQVLEQLEEFQLTKAVVPDAIGGDVVINHEQWLEARRSKGL